MKNGGPCPRPKCIPWPENELAAHVTHDLHRKRPVTPYNDRSTPESAWAHSMTYNPSLLSCKIEIDNKMLYWFPCLHSGWVFKTAHAHVWILTTVTTVCVARNCCSLHQFGFSKIQRMVCIKTDSWSASCFSSGILFPSDHGAAAVAAIHTRRGSLFMKSETVMTLWHWTNVAGEDVYLKTCRRSIILLFWEILHVK